MRPVLAAGIKSSRTRMMTICNKSKYQGKYDLQVLQVVSPATWPCVDWEAAPRTPGLVGVGASMPKISPPGPVGPVSRRGPGTRPELTELDKGPGAQSLTAKTWKV